MVQQGGGAKGASGPHYTSSLENLPQKYNRLKVFWTRPVNKGGGG